VPGGGIALLNASHKIDTFSVGEEILIKAIRAPFHTILRNAGIEFASLESISKTGYGLNVITGETVNMIEAGIIDPLLVTKSALRNAASVAVTILSTDCVINNLRA
jgi:chaperonin GroEL